MSLADPQSSVIANATKNGAKAAYLLLADDYIDDPGLWDSLKGIEFIVVQASYGSPVIPLAHVVIPSPITSETEGNYTTLDGMIKSASRLLQPPDGVKQDGEVFQEISKRLSTG
jgi:assimilatory nitrate reductase catalytic subunit